MSVTKARQIVLAARPQGKPRVTDFRLEETAVPTPGPGQVLLHVQYLSLDPYMRERMNDRESYQTPKLVMRKNCKLPSRLAPPIHHGDSVRVKNRPSRT